jgi:hypothetical protein
MQQRLQANDQTHVDRRQDDRERPVHQRAVDQRVDPPTAESAGSPW